jgi:hypothetical protein
VTLAIPKHSATAILEQRLREATASRHWSLVIEIDKTLAKQDRQACWAVDFPATYGCLFPKNLHYQVGHSLPDAVTTTCPHAGMDLRIFEDRCRIDETRQSPQMRKASVSQCFSIRPAGLEPAGCFPASRSLRASLRHWKAK